MMNASPERFHRRSIRYSGYDYAQPGAYFVTIVTLRRVCMFGDIVDGAMKVNHYGQIVTQTWEWLPKQYPYVKIDPYIVMPNHFHGILSIIEFEDGRSRGGSRPAPTGLIEEYYPLPYDITKIKPLGQLIGVFKTISAKKINQIRSTPGVSVWQRNYYERIIRDENELNDISMYINFNPQTWQSDSEYQP